MSWAAVTNCHTRCLIATAIYYLSEGGQESEIKVSACEAMREMPSQAPAPAAGGPLRPVGSSAYRSITPPSASVLSWPSPASPCPLLFF